MGCIRSTALYLLVGIVCVLYAGVMFALCEMLYMSENESVN